MINLQELCQRFATDIMQDMFAPVNESCIGDMMTWMDTHGCAIHYQTVLTWGLTQEEENQAITEKFIIAYQTWTRQAIQHTLASIIDDMIMPKNEKGQREYYRRS